MKFTGIIPEFKNSETLDKEHYGSLLRRFNCYPIISVNTSILFDGDIEDLRAFRQFFPKKYLIQKDFIMIPKQIKESKEAGANAVLLLKNYLTEEQYEELVYTCHSLKITPLTEVQGKMQPSVDCLVMINSRDLNTGKINKKQAEELCKDYKQAGFNVIYASGENSDRVVKKGIADAVLIGTAFMQNKLKGVKDDRRN